MFLRRAFQGFYNTEVIDEEKILTKENYKDNHYYLSYSRFSKFLDCEAAAFADYKTEPTTAFLVGSYVDAHFSGEMSEFQALHPEMYNSRTGELKKDFVKADEIITRIEQDPLLVHYMSGEKQAIMSGEIDGVPFKIKMDSYLKDEAIVDLKIMKDFNKVWSDAYRAYINFVEAFDYDIELAIFQEIVRQNTGKVLPCYLVCATKENPPDIGLFEIPQDALDKALQTVRNNLPRYMQIRQGKVAPHRCEKCPYCRSSKKARLISYEYAGMSGDELREEGIESNDEKVKPEENSVK